MWQGTGCPSLPLQIEFLLFFFKSWNKHLQEHLTVRQLPLQFSTSVHWCAFLLCNQGMVGYAPVQGEELTPDWLKGSLWDPKLCWWWGRAGRALEWWRHPVGGRVGSCAARVLTQGRLLWALILWAKFWYIPWSVPNFMYTYLWD